MLAPYAAVSCIVSYLMTGHRSVYPSQVIASTKSPSILVTKGIEMEKLRSIRIKPRPHSITGLLLGTFRKNKQNDRDQETEGDE